MPFQIGRMLDGHFVWFAPNEMIPSSVLDVRPAPENIATLAARILAQDARGKISDHTASAMRAALDAVI